MIQKLIVGIFIVVFTTFCGYFLAGNYRKRKVFFWQFCEFNERYLAEISYYRRPIRQFIERYNYTNEFNDLLQDFINCTQDRERNINGILENSKYSFLKEDERNAIENYFFMLGKGDSASQKEYFSTAKNSLIKYSNEAEIHCKKYADLYIKIGFLFGVFILILIL